MGKHASIDNGLRAQAELGEFWNVLVHVVRNAVDHGIESREDRQRLGKGPARIELRASLVAGGCVVEVTDDGSKAPDPATPAGVCPRLPEAESNAL